VFWPLEVDCDFHAASLLENRIGLSSDRGHRGVFDDLELRRHEFPIPWAFRSSGGTSRSERYSHSICGISRMGLPGNASVMPAPYAEGQGVPP
jgi:hypothetical protein